MALARQRVILLLRTADVGSVVSYDVEYDECSHTTNFATAPGRLDTAQSKQHTFLTPTSHHWSTLYLRPTDVWRVGGYDIGYDECSFTPTLRLLQAVYILRVFLTPWSLLLKTNQNNTHCRRLLLTIEKNFIEAFRHW